jgi:hypothetical protein
MPVRQVVVERFVLVSKKPFAEVISAIGAAIGHPDLNQIRLAAASSVTVAEMEEVITPMAGPNGLLEFFRLDMGEYIGKEAAEPKRSVRLLVGNPLIMRSMAVHAPDTASYAPVTLLIDERTDGVHLSYDRMASLLAPYGSEAASAVARDLDRKVEALLTAAAC